MAEINLAVQQFSAPGVYISQNSDNTLASAIVPFNAAYIYGEVDDLVSTSLTTGLPYNTPILVTSLADFETRLGNGNILNFSVAGFGPVADTYNSVKAFFRNAATQVGSSLYFIRIKPVEGVRIKVGAPQNFTITNSAGLQDSLLGYPLEINGFRIGRVDYDTLGNPTHIGTVVPIGTPIEVATRQILFDIVNNAPVNANVYARLLPGSNNTIEIFPRLIGGNLTINGTNSATLDPVELGGSDVDFGTFRLEKTAASDDIALGSEARIAPRDYIYAIENAIDPTVFPPGFIMAPAAFAKFNPEDRLRVGTALENRAADIRFNYVALVDCGPTDGTGIQRYYNYELFNLGSQENLDTNSNVTLGNEPFFIRETQEFYQAAKGLTNGAGWQINDGLPGIRSDEILLPASFTNVTVPVAGSPLTRGQIISGQYISGAANNELFLIVTTFTPDTVPINPLDPAAQNNIPANPDLLLGPLTLVANNDYNPALLTSQSGGAGDAWYAGQWVDGSVLADTISGVAGEGYRIINTFVPAVDGEINAAEFLANVENNGETSIAGEKVPSYLPIAQGQVLYDPVAETTYYSRLFSIATFDLGVVASALNNSSQERIVPLAYYQEWVRVNLQAGAIEIATFNPIDPASQRIGARNVLYNNVTHDAYAREHLMYNSAFGYLWYYGPFIVDLEGSNVPPSSFVAGTALRRYREQGFEEPPAGVLYPLRGALRPQVHITQAHQQASNATGMNAIRAIPNRGVVIYGARTRSANRLFKWANTRVILNVVINSLAASFDDAIFRAIDGNQGLFRQVRGRAEGVLYTLYQGEALYGASPSDAYRVIVNDSNNPNFSLEDGRINVDVFVVPVNTLEIINITVTRVATGQLNVAVNTGGSLLAA